MIDKLLERIDKAIARLEDTMEGASIEKAAQCAEAIGNLAMAAESLWRIKEIQGNLKQGQQEEALPGTNDTQTMFTSYDPVASMEAELGEKHVVPPPSTVPVQTEDTQPQSKAE